MCFLKIWFLISKSGVVLRNKTRNIAIVLNKKALPIRMEVLIISFIYKF